MCAYSAWRILAERLAAIGFDTLRFDYDGTGNSDGNDDEPGRFEAWLRSIDCVREEARRLSGSSAVALVGLRAGALLAFQASAAMTGVERLVLWSPFASGRVYVRELRAVARLCRQNHAIEDAADAGINAAGFTVTPETAHLLKEWTVETITERPAPEVLLVDHDDRPVDGQVNAHLKALGSRVTRTRPAGTAEMLRQPQFGSVPEEVLDAITAWFGDWHVSSRLTEATVETSRSSTECRDPSAVLGQVRERTLRFGPSNRLFGILCSAIGRANEVPSIVLLNTGVECHIGPQRLYVSLAREWAERGHLVFRFDLGGLGDSLPPPGADENVAYPPHMLHDLQEAIAVVRQEAPQRRVILAGLCSGGWLAFHAVREGLSVDAIISINPPIYVRDRADAMHWLAEGDLINRYRQSMRDPSKWVKALSGGASNPNFMRLAMRRLWRRIVVGNGGALDEPSPGNLAMDLRTIADRRIPSLFVFSDGDRALQFFQLHAEPVIGDARVSEFVRHVVVKGAGHSFHPREAQLKLRELMTHFVTQLGREP